MLVVFMLLFLFKFYKTIYEMKKFFDFKTNLSVSSNFTKFKDVG